MDEFLIYLLLKKEREKYDFLTRLLRYLHIDRSRYTKHTYTFNMNRRKLASRTSEYLSIRVKKKELVADDMIDDMDPSNPVMVELERPSRMDLTMLLIISSFVWSPHPKYRMLPAKKMTMFEETMHYPMIYYQEEYMTISKKFVIKINILGYRSMVDDLSFKSECDNLFFYDVITGFERQIDAEIAEEIIIGSFKENMRSFAYGGEKALRMFFENKE